MFKSLQNLLCDDHIILFWAKILFKKDTWAWNDLSTPVLNAYTGYVMEFPKTQDKFPKRLQCLPKHVFKKNSFVFNRIDSHSTLFKLFKRVNRKQT